MQENNLKKAICENRIVVGTRIGEFGTRGVPKLLEYAGIDWVMIDMEHSGWGVNIVADLIAWFAATDITCIVRPPDNDYHFIARLMDVGAMGVMVAHIETAADAQAIVDAAMYPPLGKRGVGMNAPHTEYKKPKASEYMPWRNAQTSIVAMIESTKALDNIDEICAVEGVDLIHPSHSDLSEALGVSEDYENPKFKAAIRKVGEACKRHGKAMKFYTRSEEDTKEAIAMGCRILQVPPDTVAYQDKMKENVQKVRGWANGAQR